MFEGLIHLKPFLLLLLLFIVVFIHIFLATKTLQLLKLSGEFTFIMIFTGLIAACSILLIKNVFPGIASVAETRLFEGVVYVLLFALPFAIITFIGVFLIRRFIKRTNI